MNNPPTSTSRLSSLEALANWGQRQWLTALAAAVTYILVVGIPTDLIPNPVFGREIPPTWWSWPSLALSSVLLGLLAGTYVNTTAVSSSKPTGNSNSNRHSVAEEAHLDDAALAVTVKASGNANTASRSTASAVNQNEADLADSDTRRGLAAGMLTFFAVGCPVCNKVVLLALGSAGAIKWFEPMQPLLQVAAVALVLWALRVRLRNQLACELPAA